MAGIHTCSRDSPTGVSSRHQAGGAAVGEGQGREDAGVDVKSGRRARVTKTLKCHYFTKKPYFIFARD